MEDPGFHVRCAYSSIVHCNFLSRYGVSTKAKAAANSVKTSIVTFDQENRISATIKDKADIVDAKFGITEKSQNATRSVVSKFDEMGAKAKETAPVQKLSSFAGVYVDT